MRMTDDEFRALERARNHFIRHRRADSKDAVLVRNVVARIDAERKAWVHALEALRYLARQPCKPRNCGTVCLCPPCHARRALDDLDPEWRP